LTFIIDGFINKEQRTENKEQGAGSKEKREKSGAKT
jgi:hypothetical protein